MLSPVGIMVEGAKVIVALYGTSCRPAVPV